MSSEPGPAAPVPALSVVVPAHNETGDLAGCVDDLLAGLRARGETFELLIVENGSTDGTAALARELAREAPELTVLSLPRADYGAALRAGLLGARAAVVASFDVDYYDLDFLDRAWHRLGEEPDAAIVVASKRAVGAVDARPVLRRVVTGAFAMVLRIGFGLQVSDTHGMKVSRRASVAPLVERSRFGTDLFDTEIILRAERAGLRVIELPVTVEERRPARTPILRRAGRTVIGLVRLRVALARDRARPPTPNGSA